MISYIKRLFSTKDEMSEVVSAEVLGEPTRILPTKDPKDLSLTPSSTPWENQKYWRRSCKTNRSFNEYLADTCNNCGSYYKIDTYGCNIRKMWNGEKWVTQYNERGNKSWLSD